MIIFVGASASGKTELARALFQIYGYQKCITTTTRAPRVHEIDGVDYHFLSLDRFRELQKNDAFIEVTEYQNHFYGIQKKDVKKEGIVILDPNGANTLIEKLSQDVFLIYVSTNEIIRKNRMLERKDRKETVIKRIEADRLVFDPKHLKRIDLIVTNENHSILELAHEVHEKYQNYLKKRGVIK